MITLSLGDTGSMEGLHMFALGGDVSAAILVDVLIEGQMLSMEVDTGVVTSVILRDMLQSLLPQVIPSKTHLRLRTFTGEKLPLAGMVRVKVSYRKQTKLLTLYITENPGPSLLGRAWISKLKLNAFEWEVVSVKMVLEEAESAELNVLLSEFEDVFEDDKGEMKDFQATLELKQGAVPKLFAQDLCLLL